MASPLLSIITVCLNNRAGLTQTAQTIASQVSRDYQWVVIDGGSTDGTRGIINQFLPLVDYWVSERDNGPYDAMNKGMDQAKGQYILFMNSGDQLAAPDTIARISNAVKHYNHPDLLYGDSLEMTVSGEHLFKQARSHRTAWYGMFAHHQSILYRRKSVSSIRYRVEYPIGADYAFTLEALRQANGIARLSFAVSIFKHGGLSFEHARQGRIDQWNIRRVILNMGLFRRVSISSLQIGASISRRFLPKVYAALRY